MSYSDTELMIFIELIWFSITFVLFNSSELFLYKLPLLNRSGKALHLSTICYSFSFFFLLGMAKTTLPVGMSLWGYLCSLPREKCVTDILHWTKTKYNLNIIAHRQPESIARLRYVEKTFHLLRCPLHSLYWKN